MWFLLLLATVLTLNAADMDDLLATCQTNRANPLECVHTGESFYEYYVSGHNLSCGFRLFGLERDSGISQIKEQSENDVVKMCLVNAFENGQKDLDFYLQGNQSIPLEANVIENGLVEGHENSWGLLDALAFTQSTNFDVYVRCEDIPNSIVLIHKFHQDSFLKKIHALYHGAHFNLLVPLGDLEGNEEAQIKELEQIEITKRGIESETFDYSLFMDSDSAIDHKPELQTPNLPDGQETS